MDSSLPQSRVTPELEDLMRAVALGDEASFALLYDRTASVVFGIVRRIVRSQEHAEEVTQEVYLEVWRKARNWDPSRGSVLTWMMLIARARATDRVRSEQAARDRQERVAPSWVELPADRVAEEVSIAFEQGEVRNLLGHLTDLQREVIELAYFGGRTYPEVARMLDLPLGTVKTRMRDGLLRLRQALGATS
ncbi:MAG TPA: ECF RNA polymerase sigma factor SigK [Acidimicrobiia bacterium]|nr:ECF RNA polymerase sigma factor SigK [Acidimicrobiia bacterium]